MLRLKKLEIWNVVTVKFSKKKKNNPKQSAVNWSQIRRFWMRVSVYERYETVHLPIEASIIVVKNILPTSSETDCLSILLGSSWHWFWPWIAQYTCTKCGAHDRCDRLTVNAFSSWACDSTSGILVYKGLCLSYTSLYSCLDLHGTWYYLGFAFVGDPCCPTFDFAYAFWIIITFWHIVNFAILYYRSYSHLFWLNGYLCLLLDWKKKEKKRKRL
jgi:hypothetical protein